MTKFLFFIFTLSLIVSCNKEEENNKAGESVSKINVTGLKDIEILQAFDSVKTIISLDGGKMENADVALSVINLPENLKATVTPLDSINRDFGITITAQYKSRGTPYYPTSTAVPAGMVNARLLISTESLVEQHNFNINVKPHPVLAIAGKYRQDCNCPLDTVSGDFVEIIVEPFPRPDTASVIFLQGIRFQGKQDLISSCKFNYENNIIPKQVVRSYTGEYLAIEGSYTDSKISLQIGSLHTFYKCSMTLSR